MSIHVHHSHTGGSPGMFGRENTGPSYCTTLPVWSFGWSITSRAFRNNLNLQVRRRQTPGECHSISNAIGQPKELTPHVRPFGVWRVMITISCPGWTDLGVGLALVRRPCGPKLEGCNSFFFSNPNLYSRTTQGRCRVIAYCLIIGVHLTVAN